MNSFHSRDQPATLGLLPHELLVMIVEQISPCDIIALARVNRLLHQRMIPFLYKKFTVKQKADFYDFELDQLTKTIFNQDGSRKQIPILAFTRELDLVDPEKHGCLRISLEASSGEARKNILAKHAQTMGDLSMAANEVLVDLQKDRLHHFGWHLGNCIPPSILGSSGYIPYYQSNLRSLSLRVDGACVGNRSLDGLAHLNNLRHFSWRGIDSRRAFLLVRTVLANNCEHLVSLDLELLRLKGALQDIPEHRLDLIWLGLLHPSGHHVTEPFVWRYKDLRLKSLTHLSLRNVTVGAWGANDNLTFDIAKLVSLRLDKCPKTLRFFDRWLSSNHGISLQSFQGIIDEPWMLNRRFSLDALLRKFRLQCRLEELYLTFIGVSTPRINFDAYAPGLKRMIFSFWERKARADGIDMALSERFSVASLLKRLPSMEGLAIFRPPNELRRDLQDCEPATSLKVIHFRITNRAKYDVVPAEALKGPPEATANLIRFFERYLSFGDEPGLLSEVIDFAAWAFDCLVFPNLQIIAFGNFLTPDTCVVLRRKKGFTSIRSSDDIDDRIDAYLDYRKRFRDTTAFLPFEFVNPDDERAWIGLEKCREMLTANDIANTMY